MIKVQEAIKNHELFLRIHQETYNNSESIREEYLKTQIELKSEKKSFKECVDLCNVFDRATKKRKGTFNSIQYFTGKRVNWYFKEFLKEKGMKGEIRVHHNEVRDPKNPEKILHKAETLEVISQPISSSKNSFNYDLRSLSGGERSFSTVSFIVSLWNIASTPFRILDEVDVFMDQITRRVCLEMLVTFATHKSCDQFLFLSPLTIPDLEPSPKVKVFQMPVVQR